MPLTYSHGAAYGWRARIALLQPGVVSDTNPFEFYLMAPPGVALILTSLGVGGMTQANYDRAIGNLEQTVSRVLPRRPDAIIQSGIPPLVTRGWGAEDELRARVAKVTPVPYIADAEASIRAMKATGISRAVMVSGFNDEMAGLIREYMGHAGITITGAANVQSVTDQEAGTLPLEVVYRLARSAFEAHPGADGIWITQASIPSVGVIDDLERDLGVPVVSSAQALMWAGLGMAGVREPVTGFGRLFEAAWAR